jgi:hypothetical protein
LDTNLVANAGGQVIGDSGYSIFYDVNGGGAIGNLDTNLVRNNGGSLLPVADPVAPSVAVQPPASPSAATTQSPTTQGSSASAAAKGVSTAIAGATVPRHGIVTPPLRAGLVDRVFGAQPLVNIEIEFFAGFELDLWGTSVAGKQGMPGRT